MTTWQDDTAINVGTDQFDALNYLLKKTFDSKKAYPDIPRCVKEVLSSITAQKTDMHFSFLFRIFQSLLIVNTLSNTQV